MRTSIFLVLSSALIIEAFPAARRSTTDIRNSPPRRRVNFPVFKPQLLSGNDSNFDVLEHLAGISPYFNAPGVSIDPSPPDSCTVASATYLIRHSNIYANEFDYDSVLTPFISKLANFTPKSDFTSQSALPQFAFLANWTSPITNASAQVESLTPSGIIAAQAFGQVIANLYPRLLPNTSARSSPSYNVWASESKRTIGSGNGFISGLFPNGNASANLVIIPEGEDESANSLTPHESCPNFSGSTGSTQSSAFMQVYTTPIVQRLNAVFPTFNFTAIDIYAMQQLCGYETVITGTSNFCQAFEQEDWLGFEYTNDIMYFYGLGYGTELSPVLGVPWINASTTLLARDIVALPSSQNSTITLSNQSLFLSFTHREEPPFVLTALGLFNNSAYTDSAAVNDTMPLDRINYNRAWRTSNILPFLGHVALERLSCSSPFTVNGNNETTTAYIRALVNGAAIPFPNCQNGPGASCPLTEFVSFVQELSTPSTSSTSANSTSSNTFGDFIGMCGINTTEVANATNSLGIYWGAGPGSGVNATISFSGYRRRRETGSRIRRPLTTRILV